MTPLMGGAKDRLSLLRELERELQTDEAKELIDAIQFLRWTGRRGYSPRAMVGTYLLRSITSFPSWTMTLRLIEKRPELQRVLGCVPSQWACYRFERTIRELAEVGA